MKILRAILMLFVVISFSATAQDVLTVKTIGYELARDIANATLLECRKQGYQVSVVVVDRSGILQVAVRDELAPRFTLEIAERKANTVIMSGIDTGVFVKNRSDIQQEINHIDGLIMMRGGVLIEAAGAKLGAVGVSGAPGGDKDEACALKAISLIKDRLDFVD